MGCVHPSQGKGALDPKNNCDGISNIDLIEPDPDYRWLQISLAMMVNETFRLASLGVNLNGDLQDWVVNPAKKLQQEHCSYPQGWVVFCLNSRTGHFCRVSLIDLAINISVRAKQLAEAFGVLNENSDAGYKTDSAAQEVSPNERSRRPVFEALDIPDFGWRLITRNAKDAVKQECNRLLKEKQEKDQPFEKRRSPPTNLQLLESGSGRKFHVDIPTVGMNIAEQLFRLERKQDNRQFLPGETFGWKADSESENAESLSEVTVHDPDGTPIVMVPEEMIMNVTQWVQQTYLTSVQF